MHGADDDRHGDAASPWWNEESTRNFVVATPGMSSDDEAAWSDHEVRTARACEREPSKACGGARQAPAVCDTCLECLHLQGEMPARRLAESAFDALAVGAAEETEEGSGEVAVRPWSTARIRKRRGMTRAEMAEVSCGPWVIGRQPHAAFLSLPACYRALLAAALERSARGDARPPCRWSQACTRWRATSAPCASSSTFTTASSWRASSTW